MQTLAFANVVRIVTTGVAAAALSACSDGTAAAPRTLSDGAASATPGSYGGGGGHGGDNGSTADANSGASKNSDASANGGGSTSALGTSCPYSEPTWAAPNIQNPVVCDGIAAVPALGKWLDDFDNTQNIFDTTLTWQIATDTTNGSTLGKAIPSSLGPWGSHDTSSHNGLRLQAYTQCAAPLGANNWGAQWQYETPHRSGGRAVLDLSSYRGIVLWARLVGAPGKGNLIAAFPTPQTTPTEFGGDGTCGSDPATSTLCYGYYQARAKVTALCWAPIDIKFSDLQPMGTPPAGGFDRAHVFGLELQVTAWGTAAKANFPVDVLIDDIYLY